MQAPLAGNQKLGATNMAPHFGKHPMSDPPLKLEKNHVLQKKKRDRSMIDQNVSVLFSGN